MHDITRERHLLTLIKTRFLTLVVSFQKNILWLYNIYTNIWGKLSCNLSFIFDHPIICKINIDQSENSSHCDLGFDTERLIGLIADWSVETMNPDMILDGMSLDVSVLSKKNNLKRYNKCLIFINLIWNCQTDNLRPQSLKYNTVIS